MSTQCTLPPKGWACTRTAGHEGPCATVPATDWEYYREEMSGGLGITMFFHTVREVGGKNIARFHDKEIARRIASVPELERKTISQAATIAERDAEIARLREALKNLLTHQGITDAHDEDIDAEDHKLVAAAKEALAGKPLADGWIDNAVSRLYVAVTAHYDEETDEVGFTIDEERAEQVIRDAYIGIDPAGVLREPSSQEQPKTEGVA